ncbi:HAMP domain-containing sensor histidine kinase [Metabacillus sp. RGM 3146]|uniref:sensor histidine kinase n=1 Tax=Metabacillus sp. RGM 3146 TaxID=3401092 RepID=UPI003B9B8D07
MKSRMKLRFSNSLTVRLTGFYILNLFVIMVIIGSIILFAASYFLINNTKQDTYILQSQLIKASLEKQIDWQEAIDNLLYPNYGNYYVDIIDSKGKTIARSHGWEHISSVKDTENYTGLLQHVIFNKGNGLCYKSSATWTEANGEKGKIVVISQLKPIWDFLSLLSKVLIISTVLGGILGSIIIFLVTKRTINPLKTITKTVSKMIEFMDFKTRIPILKGPDELTILANSFNTLLIKIEDQFDKERAFVSNASHELRTPITAFSGHLNLLKRWGKKEPEILEQSIKSLQVEGERMQRLIDQLLTLARTDSPYIKRSFLNLGSVIEEVKQELILSLQPGIDISSVIEENVKVQGNLDQIRQVAIILIENAIKYTYDSGNIFISVFPQNNWGVLQVRDSGIGIDENDINKIFERFYRIDKARSRKTGGAGLGLSIAKEIIESHGGTIEVESKLGVGSTFTVKLPISN